MLLHSEIQPLLVSCMLPCKSFKDDFLGDNAITSKQLNTFYRNDHHTKITTNEEEAFLSLGCLIVIHFLFHHCIISTMSYFQDKIYREQFRSLISNDQSLVSRFTKINHFAFVRPVGSATHLSCVSS